MVSVILRSITKCAGSGDDADARDVPAIRSVIGTARPVRASLPAVPVHADPSDQHALCRDPDVTQILVRPALLADQGKERDGLEILMRIVIERSSGHTEQTLESVRQADRHHQPATECCSSPGWFW